MNISVCIATFNGEKFITAQLQSILAQLNETDEVVVSDDSSTDRTVDIIKAIKDPRIRIFENQKFRSPIFNFENAISNATNQLIFLADQDDLWREGRVEAMKAALAQYDVVVCDHEVIDDADRIIRGSYFKSVPPSSGMLDNLLKNRYFGCCLAFRSTILKKLMPFPGDIPMHDIWIGFVSSIFFRTVFINEPYTLYRKHSENVTNATEIQSENGLMTKLKFRLNLIKYLPLLIKR